METITIKNTPICVYITCNDKDEARKIAKALLEEKCIASANILPQIESLFYWDEADEANEANEHTTFCDRQESVLLLFAKEDNFEHIKKRVLELHSYILPCIIAFPLSLGHDKFIEWMCKN